MSIAEWLDQKETQGVDVSHISLPAEMANEEEPDETIFFKEIRKCGILCTGNHPFATVERYGRWYYCRGREKEAGPHTAKPEWRLFTRDRELAVKTARLHIES